MEVLHKKVIATTNLYKARILRMIYFENTIIGRTIGLLGFSYMSASERVKALTLIRVKNDAVKL